MNMKLFNEKLKLIDENYPLTLPPWVTLGGQVISGGFYSNQNNTYGLVLFKTQEKCKYFIENCLPLARKIKHNPQIIE